MNRIRSTMIVVLLAAMAVSGRPGFAAADSIEVPIHISGRTPLLEVRINGNGPYRFVIDTGSRYTEIDETLAKELGLSSHTSTRSGDAAAEDDENSYYTLPVLELGGLELRDVEAKKWESHPFSPGGEAPDGILGTELLADYLLTIDNPGGVVTIEKGSLPKPNGRDIFAYTMVDDAPQVQAALGDIRLEVQIHSASFGPVLLRTDLIEQLSLRNEPGRIGNVSIDGVTADILGARLAGTMTVGTIEFDRPSLHFSDAFSANQLGFGVLGNFVITLDQANHRVRLYAEESFDEQLATLAAQVPSLDDGAEDLKTAFNNDKDKTRLIVILSPT